MLILCVCCIMADKPALIPVRVHISQTQTGLNVSRVVKPELSISDLVCGVTVCSLRSALLCQLGQSADRL